MKKKVRVGIVGGGISGLTVAYRLERALPYADIILLEASGRLGGKIMTEQDGELIIERGPESVLAKKVSVMELIQELGLSSEIIERIPEHNQTFIQSGGLLHPLPSGMSGLVPSNMDSLKESTLISSEGIDRYLREPDQPQKLDDDDESIASFATRRFGKEVYEKIVGPLLSGIYGGSGEELSILSTFPQLRHLEKTQGSILASIAPSVSTSPYASFVSLRGGMEVLIRALVDALTKTKIILHAPVTSISRNEAYHIKIADGRTFEVDILVMTTPATVNSIALAPLDGTLAKLHQGIPYSSSTIVTLVWEKDALEHPLDGYGYIVPRGEQEVIHAVTWTSHKWPNRSPENRFLLRAFLGGGSDPLIDQTDDHILEKVRTELSRVLGIIAEPLAYRIDRYADAMPQYLVDHGERVTAIEARTRIHPDLFLTGMTYRGVGIPDCISQANTVALAVEQSLSVPR